MIDVALGSHAKALLENLCFTLAPARVGALLIAAIFDDAFQLASDPLMFEEGPFLTAYRDGAAACQDCADGADQEQPESVARGQSPLGTALRRVVEAVQQLVGVLVSTALGFQPKLQALGE
ncbi:MAG: hypothetical protein JW993_00430 [Sedimentisphaerales bacterium]|nr:hypothetical protein [Sedimentisphaerales bacterium]